MKDDHLRELQALRSRVAMLESILDSIHDGFFTLDNNYNFTYVNNTFKKLCGVGDKEMVGINYWDYFPKAKNMKFWTEYHNAIATQSTMHFEEYATSMSKWVAVTAYPSPEGLSVYFRDVTEERISRLTIKLQNERLLEIAQIQSHKVRKPVASIMGLAPLLRYDNQSSDTESNKKIIKGIVDCCKELDEVIREIDRKTDIAITNK